MTSRDDVADRARTRACEGVSYGKCPQSLRQRDQRKGSTLFHPCGGRFTTGLVQRSRVYESTLRSGHWFVGPKGIRIRPSGCGGRLSAPGPHRYPVVARLCHARRIPVYPGTPTIWRREELSAIPVRHCYFPSGGRHVSDDCPSLTSDRERLMVQRLVFTPSEAREV